MSKKITINRQLLLSNLKYGITILQEKAIMPVYSSFLFEKKDNKITITCSSTEMEIITEFEQKQGDDMSVLIEGNIFFSTLSALKDEEITIVINEKFQMLLNAGKKKYIIPTNDPSQFPHMTISNDIRGIHLSADTIRKYLPKAAAATRKQDIAEAFRCVEIKVENNNLTILGLHSSFMYRSLSPFEAENITVYIIGGLSDVIKEMDTKETMFIGTDGRNTVFKCGNITINALTLATKYVNANPLFAIKRKPSFIVNKTAMLDSLKRLRLFSGMANDIFITCEDNSIVMRSEFLEAAKRGVETIDCQIVEKFEEIRLAQKLLLLTLNNIESEEVVIEMGANIKVPIMIYGNGEMGVEERFLIALMVSTQE